MYELNFNIFQLPEGVIPLDILPKVNHKTPQHLNIPVLDANNSFCSISMCSPLVTLVPAAKCEEIQEVSWNQVYCGNAKLLLEIVEGTSLQLEPDTKSPLRPKSDADIPEEARAQLQELLDQKYINIISQTTMDIGRTNLIELDIPTEGPLVVSRPYSVPLKYCDFMDPEIKQLEEASIISRSMSDWASPILLVPNKEECTDTGNNTSGSKSRKFNL